MPKLPDLEGLAIFAKVVQTRSFVGAADELQLSKATVSKAVGRIEEKFGTRLFNRTARRLAVTEAGRQLYERAAHILAEGEAAEDEVIAQSAMPRGRIRLTAPISFGVLHIAPILPEFLAQYPDVIIDLHLSDNYVDLIGEGYDAAIRIASLLESEMLPIDQVFRTVQLATSELAFICDQRHRSTSIGVMLIPFDGTFESHRDPVPILIQKNSDQYDRTDVIQNWRNGNEFLFLDGKDDVAELVSLFKERDSFTEKSVYFLFPNDVDSGPPTTNHIVVSVSGFSDGFRAFEKACAKAQ